MTTKDMDRSIYVKLLQEKIFLACVQPFTVEMLDQYGHRKLQPLIHSQISKKDCVLE